MGGPVGDGNRGGGDEGDGGVVVPSEAAAAAVAAVAPPPMVVPLGVDASAAASLFCCCCAPAPMVLVSSGRLKRWAAVLSTYVSSGAVGKPPVKVVVRTPAPLTKGHGARSVPPIPRPQRQRPPCPRVVLRVHRGRGYRGVQARQRVMRGDYSTHPPHAVSPAHVTTPADDGR